MRIITLQEARYCRVRVYLLTTGEGSRRGFVDGETLGCCETVDIIKFDKFGREKETTEIHIYLLESRLGGGSLAHELVHAAFSILRRYRKGTVPADFFEEDWKDDIADKDMADPGNNPEEFVAYLVGNMMMEFWSKYYKRGYGKEGLVE